MASILSTSLTPRGDWGANMAVAWQIDLVMPPGGEGMTLASYCVLYDYLLTIMKHMCIYEGFLITGHLAGYRVRFWVLSVFDRVLLAAQYRAIFPLSRRVHQSSAP